MARTGLGSFINNIGKAVKVYNKYAGSLSGLLPAPANAAFIALEAVYNLLVALKLTDVE